MESPAPSPPERKASGRTRWTLVGHRALYFGDERYQQAVQAIPVTDRKVEQRIKDEGGLVFSQFEIAEATADLFNHPDGDHTTKPAADGRFASTIQPFGRELSVPFWRS